MAGTFVNPQDSSTTVDGIVDDAQQIVNEKISEVTEAGQGALQTAEEFLGQLGEVASDMDNSVPIIVGNFPPPKSYDFDPGATPTSPEVVLPMPEFPVSPILQSITLLTQISTRLQTDLARGVTGIDPAREQDIWNRNYERDLVALEENKERIAAEWSKRCFDLPDGVLVGQLTQAEIDFRNKRLDTSRDIAIKQAELAFQNSQFIIQQILAMENMVITAVQELNRNNIGKFSADVEGYKAQIAAAVQKLEAQIRKYEADANVYRAKAEAQSAIASVDVKAAEVEIQTCIAQLQLYVKQAENQIRNREVIGRLRVEAAHGGAQVAAALASGMFAGVSVQAHITASGQASKSYSGTESLSESHQYQEK